MVDTDIIIRRTPGTTLANGLADALGIAIVAGRYDDRPLPTEAALGKMTGTSRSVVREAVKMLAAKGLVISSPRRGAEVRPREEWNLLDPCILGWIERGDPAAETVAALAQVRSAVLAGAAALTRANSADQTGDNEDVDAETLLLVATGNPFFAALETLVSVSARLSQRRAGRRQPQ